MMQINELKYEDVEEFVSRHKEFRIREVYSKIGKKYLQVDYSYKKEDSFDEPISLDCRGALFDIDTKECVLRPMPKIMNIDHSKLDKILLDHNTRAYIKIDGTLIMCCLVDGKLLVKTTRSCSGSFVDLAYSLLAKGAIYSHPLTATPIFDTDEFESGKTYMFEMVGGNQNHVITYATDTRLIYLGVRDNKIGYYTPSRELRTFFKLEELNDDTNHEGLVYITKDGTMYKAKTEWYISLHKVLTEWDVLDFVKCILDDKIDDIFEWLSMYPAINSDIRHFYSTVCQIIESINNYTESIMCIIERLALTQKEIAEYIKKNYSDELCSLLFAKSNKNIKQYESVLRNMVFNHVKRNIAYFRYDNLKLGWISENKQENQS